MPFSLLSNELDLMLWPWLICRFQPCPRSRTNEQDGWCCREQVKEAVSVIYEVVESFLDEDVMTSDFVHTQVVCAGGGI
jgi:hypothetical protein